ncbi:MAG: DnrP protein [Methylophaga sp.]|nr:MAG: DnrP protein [Methylophaga sp.]
MPLCNHCGQDVKAEDEICASCGIPLPPNHADQRQRTFIRWFIVLVIFCVVVMLWLPPDWSGLS